MDTKWYYCLCQHPMWLLIAEGEGNLFEKTFPCNRSLKEYARKFKRVLSSLKRLKDLKMAWEVSGMEWEMIEQHCPDLIQALREYSRRGKAEFVEGSFSQPHFQLFGSESNYRQFEYGHAALKKVFNVKTDLYIRQETGFHEQLPQILKGFGYRFATLPATLWVLRFLDNPATPEIVGRAKFGDMSALSFVHDEPFSLWQGIDGTVLPVYMNPPWGSERVNEGIRLEEEKDLFGEPRIVFRLPDMERITKACYDQLEKKKVAFSLPGDALRREMSRAKPMSRVRLYTYWAYCEGVWGDKLLRKNKEAENVVSQVEAMDAMATLLLGNSRPDRICLWRRILSSQHHDIHWTETRLLKRKGIRWLDESIQGAREGIGKAGDEICRNIDTEHIHGERALTLFDTIPSKRDDVVAVSCEFKEKALQGLTLKSAQGETIPFQLLNVQRDKDKNIKKCKLFFPANLAGLGYQTYLVSYSRRPHVCREKLLHGPIWLGNRFYSARINPDGTFASLTLKACRAGVLRTDAYLGNEIRFRLPSGKWMSSRGSSRGTRWISGPVFDLLRINGSMGGITYEQNLFVYSDIPRIDIYFVLNFDKGMDLGNFFSDETKMNIYWPLDIPDGKICYDIPFGVVEGREDRPLFAVSWIDISNPQYGCSFINYGTPKHWVKNGVMANVLAWGGKKYGFRYGPFPGPEKDLSLKGVETFRFSILPHAGDWRHAGVPAVAQSASQPPAAIWSHKHSGVLPLSKRVLSIEGNNILCTSAKTCSDGKLVCRVYETHGKKGKLRIKKTPFDDVHLYDLAGREIDVLSRFQIAHLECRSNPPLKMRTDEPG